MTASPRTGQDGKVRYAVVGLGHIVQAAVLPAFKHAAENSTLAALVSDDPAKLKELGDRYGVDRRYSCAQYDECLRGGDIDAVFIGLPNHLHAEYTVRAARAGVHVLCEKPMATSAAECEQMIQAADAAGVKLMIAYRLHFEEANLKAVDLVRAGAIGEPRLFNSTFTMQVADDNIRIRRETGGGVLWDIGVYCVNAARYLFRAEPLEVTGFAAAGDDPRFAEVEESFSGVMRFPGERLATFTCSFGAASMSSFRVVGTKGDLRVEPAYSYAADLTHYRTVGGKTETETFRKRDQFAPELAYFAKCILKGHEVEPSGREGLADVRIIEALYQSAQQRRSVAVSPLPGDRWPTLAQADRRPAVREPELVHAAPPSKK